MLTITIPESELYDEANNKFIPVPETKLILEHSLVSLSKWEQKWEKPFLGKDRRTTEETLDYIKCMTISPEEVSDTVYDSLNDFLTKQVSEYIDAKMTATWFSETPGKKENSSETVTAEIIYYWMIALNIPFEVQHWHLNRLLTLIRVVNIKNDPKKTMMPQRDVVADQRRLNEERRAKFATKG